MSVGFGLLGPVRAWRDGVELPLGARPQRAVLAVLLLAKRRQVSADELIGAVWGSSPPRSALMATRTYVSRLRTLLDDIEIRAIGGGYQLMAAPAAVDVSIFHETRAAARAAHTRGDLPEASRLLHDALRLWRGPALEDLTGPYFATRRQWLQEQRATTRQDSWSLAIDLGLYAEAIADLTQATAENPYHEQLWALLVQAQTLAGLTTDAAATYARISQILAEDLGLEPGPALRATVSHRSVA
ncbi:BTAD domain-containing putative transcriptional regulator [Kribbella sp. NPDC051770]|uniref:AfsR/SARP family transcriptional regulator n=1 Tax=Kribbella sp. NPDC051770 TaxID=3155413 RepID=UPI00344A0466